MGHDHAHHHHEAPSTHYPGCRWHTTGNIHHCFCEDRLYKRGMLLSSLSVAVALIGADLSQSRALVGDAIHSFFDGIDSFLSYAVLRLAQRDPEREVPVRRWGAVIAFTLLLIAVYAILFEGITRIRHPEPVSGIIMTIGALANIAVNSFMVYFSHQTPKEVRTNTHALLSTHNLTDLLISIVVLLGGVLVWMTGISGIDGILTVFIGIYIAIKLLPYAFERIMQ